MDFKNILDKVKEKILSIYNKIIDFYYENKKLSIIIACAVLVFLCSILIIIIASSNKNKQPKTKEIPQELILSETPVIPNGPTLPKNYNNVRKPKDKWEQDEAFEWFTVPSKSEVDALSQSNENIVNEIIGAAP